MDLKDLAFSERDMRGRDVPPSIPKFVITVNK